MHTRRTSAYRERLQVIEGGIPVVDALIKAELASSKTEAYFLLREGNVHIRDLDKDEENNTKVTDPSIQLHVGKNYKLRTGNRLWAKFLVQSVYDGRRDDPPYTLLVYERKTF